MYIFVYIYMYIMDSQKLKGKELKHTARENNPTKKREKKKE